ncbi:hypothetical protein [Actinoplanes sp. NPDC049316]|uniref:hypothetical protein n=1 Tax=Actinoplanes sp. NPDC049316 TaxID=3154727 RepID=UPI00343109EF
MLISLVVGTLLVVLVTAWSARCSRRRFQDSGTAFRCRLRVRGRRSVIWPTLTRRWSRPMWALWEDDVLVVRRGPVLGRTILLRTQTPVGVVHNLDLEAPWLCGTRPVGVVLKIWDGARIEVAARAGDRVGVVGPYLAAAINDLPKAPDPRRRI